MTLERVRLDELIALARGRNASDLHVGGDAAPSLRINGRIVALDVPALGSEALEAFLIDTLPAPLVARWTATRIVDAALRTGLGAPYRLHAYATMDGTRLAFRFLAASVPTLDALGLPPAVAALAASANGLILFAGPTGSGKTTALAALVNHINRTSERVIVTIEDPVEYVHAPIRSVIAQCEIGSDTTDYASALHGAMRADPDVILIGELRDRATMAAALAAAETGHLVLSTLHTSDAAQTIDRIVDAFAGGAQVQARAQLATTLAAVVALRLVPSSAGCRAAAEILVGTDAVRAMIRDGKTHQLRNAIVTGRAAGMQTLETSLCDLVVRGAVALEAARACANRPADVRDLQRAVG